MQSIDHILQMLELMEQPAFSVREGMITGVNAAARERMILPGAPVAPMIAAGRSDYSTLRSGSMALTLDLFGIMTDATVTCIGEHRIFKLSTPEQSEQLRVLALAAQELRSPLHDAMSISRELQHDDHAHPEQQEELSARLNRELYRILRIVGNMSFHSTAHPEMRDAAAVFEEIFASAGEGSYIEPPFHCDYGIHTTVGKNFYANYNCCILSSINVIIIFYCVIYISF